jgi:hypothetical protein
VLINGPVGNALRGSFDPSMRKEDRKSPAPTSRVSFSRFLFISAIFISLLSSLAHFSGFPSLVTV